MQPQNIPTDGPQPTVTEGAPQQPPAPQQAVAAPESTVSWQFTGAAAAQPAAPNPVAANSSAPAPAAASNSIQWTASEYVAHDKSSSWYVAFVVVVALVVAAVYMLTRDIVSVVVIFVVAVLFAYSAGRRPRVRQFSIDTRGVSMDARFHPYADLKSFTVSGEGAIRSIVLTPLKRYMPPVSMYYPPDQESQIMEVLSHYLPFEPEKHDAVDRVMRRIKF